MSVTWDDTISDGDKGLHTWANNIISAIKRRGAKYVVTTDAYGDYQCDGTNDEVQIQAALDALTAARAYKEKVVCRGVFSAGAAVNIPANSILEVRGKISLADNANDHILNVSGNGVRVLGGVLNGNNANQTVSSKYPVYVANYNDFIIADTYIHDSYDDAINLNTVENFDILRCRFKDTGSAGEATSDAIDVNTGSYGSIVGNFIDSSVHDGIDVDDSTRVSVIDNKIKNPAEGGIICNTNNSLTIALNQIYSPGTYGIWLGTTTPQGIVNGNFVTDSTYDGIVITNSSESTATGNHCYSNGRHGILLSVSALDSVISGNICKDNTNDGINLSSVTGVTITGNRCVGNSKGIAMGSTDYITLQGNDCHGNTTSYLPVGAHNTYDGNVQSPTPCDLSGAAATQYLLHTESDLFLAAAHLLYTEATSADAGVTLEIGKETDRNYYYTGASANGASGRAQWYSETVTLLANDIAAGDTVTFYSPGGKTGTGEVICIIEYLVGA